MSATLPMLTGYRVLDVAQFVAGPTCTRIMAELGAEVIKLELAPFGDRGRASGDKSRDPRFKNNSQSTYFFQHNHSKKSLAIDIKQQRGRDLVRSLIPKIDVLVESFAPGAIARMGLGYDELKVINPRLIKCSISLAGQSGPLSQKPGFDYMGAAYSGITSTVGEADRGPAQIATAIGDSSTGVTAAMAVGFALLHRERTGRPIHRVLAARHILPHARSQCTEGLAAWRIIRAPAHGLVASGWRSHGGIPLQGRRIHRDHGDAVSMASDDQSDEHAGAGGRSALQHAARTARQ
jgi:crotonobetainyl-CoA:carnitine CoA-transferase CaiB-like acyl-CoA transferase